MFDRHRRAGLLRSNTYVNELGISAVADRIGDFALLLNDAGLDVAQWYGVRVFNDVIPPDHGVPEDEELVELLKVEEEAGRRDPYRRLASQTHVIARRRLD